MRWVLEQEGERALLPGQRAHSRTGHHGGLQGVLSVMMGPINNLLKVSRKIVVNKLNWGKDLIIFCGTVKI